MSTEPAVSVRRLGKRFHRGERHDSLRDLIPAIGRRLTGRAAPARAARGDFWAVDDVSFAVSPGEALGIIGPNGAGKSTMLKLLTKILRPTVGRCEVRGRVGALIEIAAGFHPDLTGRENVYLQGAIMGMPRREISRVMDQIIDFAGVEPFIDTQVKRFSSGMNARLGFSIAAHLQPDVLIIDEVLAVGDMAFQEKCIQRMQTFKRQGVAIVFVSHNMQAVSELCDRAIYLKSRVQAEGAPADVIGAYLRLTSGQAASTTSGAIEIRGARLAGPDGSPVSSVGPGTALTLGVDYLAREPIPNASFGVRLYRSTDGLLVYDGNVSARELGLEPLEPGVPFTLHFGLHAHVTRGQYHLECVVLDPEVDTPVARLNPAGILSVAETRSWHGIADLALECSPATGRPRAAVAAAGSYHTIEE